MGDIVTKNISLRTLSGDTAAISKNLRPEPEHVSVAITAAAEQTEPPTPEEIEQKKYSPTVKAFGLLFALAALGLVGYLAYHAFVTQEPLQL